MDVTCLNGKAHWKLETYKEALEYSSNGAQIRKFYM